MAIAISTRATRLAIIPKVMLRMFGMLCVLGASPEAPMSTNARVQEV